MHAIHVTEIEGLSSTVTFFAGPSCTDCPSQEALAEGIEGLALAGLLTKDEVSLQLDTTCHRCLAEGDLQRVSPRHWRFDLLAYADDPDGTPMPADGGVR